MKITVVGSGYVGLVTGACLAEMGNQVTCVDVDESKIHQLESGRIPFHEPGLPELVQRTTQAGHLRFTSDPALGVQHGKVIFIAVGSPSTHDGAADVSGVLAVARSIGQHMEEPKVVVNKSTVPVGSAQEVASTITGVLKTRGSQLAFSVVSNPEFLKEGAAVQDFMRPDRVVIGADDHMAIATMRAIYAPFVRNHDRLLVMSLRSAEFTKYAANAMLATRISFMNELSLLAERLEVDIESVRQGIGSDHRIGYDFLYAGCGYGGSCFPKDIQALLHTADSTSTKLQLLSAVQDVNQRQKQVLVGKVLDHFNHDLCGKHFALWGLAFKPNTDDVREAPSKEVIDKLLACGATVTAYDPVATENAKAQWGTSCGLNFVSHRGRALEGAHALIIVTEWKEFRSPDFDELKEKLLFPLIFDGRNLYDPGLMREMGIQYHNIGRANP